MRWRTGIVALIVVLSSCRDEQAGPKQKGARAPTASATGVQTLEAVPTDMTFRSGTTWGGGAITYLGSKVEPRAPKPGDQVTLHHYFVATKQAPAGFHFFMHLVNGQTLEMLSNLDHEIQNGAAPLGTWPLGKVVVDTHQLQMPQYAGSLGIMMGFWNDQGRLPPDQANAHDGIGRVFGPKLEGQSAPALPEYKAPKVASAPKIDGKLDDGAWKDAPEVSLTTSFDGREVKRKTRMRLVYDDTFIYVGFDCDDPDVWGSMHKKDDPIYNEEVVEVFFDADGDGATYNELQVSPHNTNFDASFVARRSDLEAAMKWESGMISAVDIRGTIDKSDDVDQGWSAEMKIPIANLNKVPHVPPQKGEKWRFNAYRLEHFVHSQNIEGQSFSPLYVGDFHALPRFGWLVFE